MSAPAAPRVSHHRYAEDWRPAFRGYQRMRIVMPNGAVATYTIEGELDGPIAVGFERWADTNAFLVGIQEAQRAPFMAWIEANERPARMVG